MQFYLFALNFAPLLKYDEQRGVNFPKLLGTF